MIGKTNVGGGTQFSATLEVATDPTAIITAVNPAGDTFGGTADSNGELTLVMNKPGTYAVTETGGGTGYIVIADDGETYSITVYAFSGTFIENGEQIVRFESYIISGSAVPTTSKTTIYGNDALNISIASGSSAVYRSEAVDISTYNAISVIGVAPGVYAYDEQNNETYLGSLDSYGERNFALSGLDKTKKYKFGVYVSGYSSATIVDMKLAGT